MTLNQLFNKVNKILEPYYGLEAVYLNYIIFENIFSLNKVELILDFDKEVSQEKEKKVFEVVEKLKKYYPIQYIFNKANCYGDDFYVDERVLIPRPETEMLIELILQSKEFYEAKKILDIGTGSGCIAITLKKHTEALVFALDVSAEALQVAKKNAKDKNVKINFLEADILKNPNLEEKFDIIVSNPPYIADSQKNNVSKNVFYEPAQALFVSDDNPIIFYKAILKFAEKHLKNKGKIFLELNEFFAQLVKDFYEKNNFNTKIINDLNQKQRFLIAQKKIKNV